MQRDCFSAEIEEVAARRAEIAPFYRKDKNCGWPLSHPHWTLQMDMAQQCFGLSDQGTKDTLYESQAIRRLVNADLACESGPDATMQMKSRRLLDETREVTPKSLRRSTLAWLNAG
ncbi:MAG: transposase [Nitrospira sp.]|nr:transposase [Nitrospira sp.]